VVFGSRFANPTIPEQAQREVYGLLIGTVTEDGITYVEEAVSIVAGQKTEVEFENQQYVDAAQIDEAIFDSAVRTRKNNFIVGWWHTHPGYGFFYSDIDIMTQLGWQWKNPCAVGIVYDYTLRSGPKPGLQVLSLVPDEGTLGIYCQYRFVPFEIVDGMNAIADLDDLVLGRLSEVDRLLKRINYIEGTVINKVFAALEKNYGLRLISKETTYTNDLQGEKKWVYEWNERDIKKQYKIPKFRAKVEKLLGEVERHPNKKKQIRAEIEKLLERPSEVLRHIIRDFEEIYQDARKLWNNISTEERMVLEHFYAEVRNYNNILFVLKTKAYYLAPDAGDTRSMPDLSAMLVESDLDIEHGEEELEDDPFEGWSEGAENYVSADAAASPHCGDTGVTTKAVVQVDEGLGALSLDEYLQSHIDARKNRPAGSLGLTSIEMDELEHQPTRTAAEPTENTARWSQVPETFNATEGWGEDADEPASEPELDQEPEPVFLGPKAAVSEDDVFD
jgi:proteasome lid subunit RPN8/RPN11